MPRSSVPLPKTNLTIRRSGKYKYVYKVLRSYRNEKGQPTNDRVCIGCLDKEGCLIPNGNYDSYFKSGEQIDPLESGNLLSVKAIGASFLVDMILQKLGTVRILKEVFGENISKMIQIIAIYMVCRGNVMDYIQNWCTEFSLFDPISPQKASYFFSTINVDEKMNFFRKWVDGNLTESHLAYDVTSFSSYAKGLKEAEWGFNRDGDKLPQINLGCYLSHTGGIPLFYVTYPGSIVDKAQLPYMMAYNEELGIKDIKFILDRGFCTTSNLQELHSMAIQYVMAVNSFHKTTRSAIDEVREDITLLRYRLNEGTYGKTINSRFYGVKSNMHVYYSTVTAERQREDLLRLVEKRGENLKHIKQLTAKEINFYSKFHDIAINTDNTISYTLNYDKIEKEAMYCGFYCILSNTSSNTKQIYNIYKQRDIIEKGFDDIKNHIDMKRLHTHNDETTNGKLFCAFIALIVTSQMTEPLRTINKSSGKGHLSRPGLLLELEKIKVLIYPRTRRLLNPLTKKQREILAAFGLSEKELKSYASCPE